MGNNTILYVEDEELYQTLVQEILTEEGFAVDVAGTGAQACEMLEKRKPDLIILDIRLPDTDGYTLCQRLRQDGIYASIPILMLTVQRRPEEWRQGFSAGANDYMAKPLHGPDLIDRVRSCLEGKLDRSEGITNPEVLMIRATLAGNRGAYEVFVRQYKDQLIHSMMRHTRNVAEAEDVACAALASAYERLRQFHGHSNFYTWLYAIAWNEFRIRRRSRKAVSLDELAGHNESVLSDPSSKDDAFLGAMDRENRLMILAQAYHSLPDAYQEILRLFYLQHIPCETIASQLGIPLGTVKSRLYTAKRLLRKAWRRFDVKSHLTRS